MSVISPNGIKYQIARIALDRELISRAEIARSLNMNPSTVGRLVDYLISRDVLQETDQASSSSLGRPPKLLRFNPFISSILTVDLRSTVAYGAITNLSGDILRKSYLPLNAAEPVSSLTGLIKLIRELLSNSAGVTPVEIITVGAPSIVDTQTGTIEWAPSFGWKKLPLRTILEDEFNLATIVENDVNLAVLGEFWKGAGNTRGGNLVFVSVGTGIGAGIVLNGELYRGSSNAAGEVAYFITDVDVLRDNAGRIGNLESRAGSEGLIRSASLIARRYPASSLAKLLNSKTDVHPNQIVDLALSGDPAAILVVNDLVDILTIVICNISVLLDLDMVVLGSPIDLNFPELIPAINNRIGTSLLRPVKLVASKLDKDAVILGGAYIAHHALNIFKQ